MTAQRPSMPVATFDLIADRFKLLGDPVRLRLLHALSDGERSVSELVDEVEGNQSNISRHLAALFDGGLVGRRRQGSLVYYFVADPIVFQLCDLVCGREIEKLRERLATLAPAPPRKARK